MDSYIDLKNITIEELKNADLDRIDVTGSPPDMEPHRLFIAVQDTQPAKDTLVCIIPHSAGIVDHKIGILRIGLLKARASQDTEQLLI